MAKMYSELEEQLRERYYDMLLKFMILEHPAVRDTFKWLHRFN